MFDLISYSLSSTFELLLSDYFRLPLALIACIGILNLVYLLAGKRR